MGKLSELFIGTAARFKHVPNAGQVIANAAAVDKRVGARQVDELIGICKGVIADGGITDGEMKFLLDWMETNCECASQWPYSILYQRIAEALADGQVTESEERELLSVLNQVTKGGMVLEPDGSVTGGTTEGLPFDQPAPTIVFQDRRFCVTGEFAYGPRDVVVEAIENRGGRVTGSVSGKTSYVVVGVTASTAWLHSTHGTKLVRALELKREGKDVAIVGEQHWMGFL